MSLRRSPLKRGSPIRKRGPVSLKWEEFRDQKAERDRNEEGLIKCQDHMIGLPRCRVAVPSPDLHHLVGRAANPSLYFEESNLIWLARGCHNDAHN